MKKLLVRFLLFVACIQGLARVDLIVLVVGVALAMACLAFLHILSTPESL